MQPGCDAYAMIPTYYDASRFIAAKVYIEYAWHNETSIFYHCMATELLDKPEVLLPIMHTCQLRSIERSTGKIALRHPRIHQFSTTVQALLTDLQIWQKDFVLDVPAPFIAKDLHDLRLLQTNIQQYFSVMLQNVNKHDLQ